MYNPVFDSQKQSLIRNVLALAERINAETPYVAGFTLDDDQTAIQLTVTLAKPDTKTFDIRLEPVTSHTNYTDDREFKTERQNNMRELMAYLQALLNAELTRPQHEHLERNCGFHTGDIESNARILTTHGGYDATVSYTGDREYLTLSIRPDGSHQLAPLMQLKVGITPPNDMSDDQSIVFKTNRNARLLEMRNLLTDLINATRKESL